jgi:hypothetical protein
MIKRKTVVDDMIQGIKKAASRIGAAAGEAPGIDAPRKIYERIVPVPQIDTYSELPFALVQKAGDGSTKSRKAAPAKSTGNQSPPRKQTAAAKAKKSVKKSAKRRSSKTK